MAGTIDRPVKRGDVRTFDESYNKGFKNIWASEVDAEFNTLYDAWNFGSINIAPGSVGSDQIQDGAIIAGKLAPNSVAGINIIDGTLTGDEFLNNSIGPGKLAPGAVDGTALASNSVDSNHIVNGSITELDLVDVLQNRLPPQWSPGEHDRVLAVDPTGQYLLWVAAPPAAPGGPAGGDLAGSTYPDPVIAPFAINEGKLAVGAAMGGSLPYTNTAQGGTLFCSQPSETAIGGAFNITTRGGPILIFAEFTGFWTLASGSQYNATWEWYIRRDTALTGTAIRNISHRFIWPGMDGIAVPETLYLPFRLSTTILDTTHTIAGTYAYHMSYKMVSTGPVGATAEYYVSQRGITLVELS